MPPKKNEDGEYEKHSTIAVTGVDEHGALRDYLERIKIGPKVAPSATLKDEDPIKIELSINNAPDLTLSIGIN